MFVILTYDINRKRVSKVMKICRKYLVHIQESVFEGTITEGKLTRLKKELKYIVEDICCEYCYMASAIERLLGRWKN